MIPRSKFIPLFVEKHILMERSGVWNETEAWPLMFKSIDVIQSLPMLDEVRSTLLNHLPVAHIPLRNRPGSQSTTQRQQFPRSSLPLLPPLPHLLLRFTTSSTRTLLHGPTFSLACRLVASSSTLFRVLNGSTVSRNPTPMWR